MIRNQFICNSNEDVDEQECRQFMRILRQNWIRHRDTSFSCKLLILIISPSIGKAFMRAAGAEYVLSILFMLLYIGFALLGPVHLVKNLLLYLENIADRPTYEGWLYVSGLFFQSFFQTTSFHFQSNLCVRVGQRVSRLHN